ncbi:MAG: hypothetical protein EBS51_12380 [Planctomycetia bacterium]|nr:hypothetical protein [Planctomycetia bacterium]
MHRTSIRCGSRGRLGPAAAAFVAWGWACGAALAQPAADAPAQPLATREEELVSQYRELERAFLRLADLLDATDPRRAALLRRVCAESREGQVSDRLDAVVRQLEQGQFLQAGASQQGLIEQLRSLHGMLAAGDDDRRLATSNQEVRQFLARLAKTIGRQRDIEAGTEGKAGEDDLAARQRQLAEETARLAGDIGDFAKRSAGPAEQSASPSDAGKPDEGRPDGNEESDGKQSDGKQSDGKQSDGKQSDGAPSDGEGESEGDDEASRARRTARRLAAAEQRMRQAQARLADARRADAREEQERAIEELENARAELQEILRQLREQEVERLLVRLEARVRDMLRIEKGLVTETRRLAVDPRPPTDRSRQLEAGRLGREQAEVGTAATRALALVRDDGTAVAVPQALEQVRDDAEQAASRLARGDTGAATTGIQEDIVAGLEELLGALERARSDPQAAQQGGAGGRAPEPGDQPLVDALAELKMLRSLQVRVNTRTGRFARLLGDGIEEAEEPELRAALGRLADRQRSIEQAAHDIVTGRTE